MLFDSLLNSQSISRNKIFSIINNAPRIISKLKEKASSLFFDNKNEAPCNKIVDTDPTMTLPDNTVTGIAVADNKKHCGIINYNKPANFIFSSFAGNTYKKIKETFSPHIA